MIGRAMLSPNGPMVGRILARGEVWPVIVVKIGVGLEDPVCVVFTQNDDVVQAFPSDRSGQPFHTPVPPWRTRGGGPVADVHHNYRGV